MNRFLMISLLSLAASSVYGQKAVQMEYDAAGNRILRAPKAKQEVASKEVSLEIWEEMEITSLQKGVYCFKCLHLNPDEIKEIGVYNTEGLKVLSPRFEGNTLTVNLSTINRRGVYIIKCVYQGQSYSYSLTN